jgi:hypothetical protein
MYWRLWIEPPTEILPDMYDIYRHISRSDLQLIMHRGASLPRRAPKETWQFAARRLNVPRIVADEIERSGFSIVKSRMKIAE